MGFQEFFALAGALGLFIYGMMVMSDGIQKLAGDKMRQILSSMTSNSFKGIGTGFLTTSLIQSSSATTVMVVSFVNAGLLSLRQSIGVIMGANIGTTMTAWLIAILGFSKFSLGNYVFPILALAVPMLFLRNEKFKNTGEFLIGFAILFLGLTGMKDAVSSLNLADNMGFQEMIRSISSMGFMGTVLLVLVGSVVTVVVQSSSAAMGLTLSLCNAGVLPFEIAAALVLGENIGTTITANLAALVGNIHAKRAARAHLIFNLFGVIWMLIVFSPFVATVKSLMLETNFTKTEYLLSAFHTSFNIINTFLLVWFVDLIARIVTKFTASKGDDELFKLEYIASGITSTPELSILEAKKEMVKFGELTLRMHQKTRDLINEVDNKKRVKLINKIRDYEEVTDRLESEITSYLGKVSNKSLTEEASNKLRSMLSITNDLERIGDIYFVIAKAIEKKSEEKLWFDQKQRDSLNKLLVDVENAYLHMLKNLEGDYSKVDMEEAVRLEEIVNATRNKIRKKHLKSVEKGDYNPRSGLIYSNIFAALERVGDHIINVSEGASGINLH